jgi:leucyl/phenylalanyl-tRNA--protein transferase
MEPITSELLLNAYCQGIFPMAEASDSDEVYWVDPKMRGIIPLDGLKISKSLKKTIRKTPFDVFINKDFTGVMTACAQSDGKTDGTRNETWINEKLIDAYAELNRLGFAHSLECWDDDGLVGGLYGVCINGCFFGESMFHTKRDASKIALAYLVARLIKGGFTLLDTQFITPHLKSLGGIEITRDDYQIKLAQALMLEGDFYSLGDVSSADTVLQLITQTS